MESTKELILADNFKPDVDLLISEGLIAFGVKGSGKSNLLALISEQLGKSYLPQVVFDSEREYQSLINWLPHAMIATANRCPSGYDILHKGLQVVVDLRSWETDEAAALAMVQLIGELFTAANAQAPQERVPCIVHLDEAGYWLPQDSITYLSKPTRQALADAFHKLATRGRKQGLTPFLYTQSISEIGKQSIRQSGIKVLMRQTLDVDLNRYAEYIRDCTPRTKRAIQSFQRGKGVVILPDGSQRAVQFHERLSAHNSHTPKASAALAKFADVAFNQDALQLRDMTTETKKPTRTPARTKQPTTKDTGKAKRGPTYKERIFVLLKHDSTLAPSQLAATLGCTLHTAQFYAKAFFGTPRRVSRQEQRIREQLAQHPDYTVSQLAKLANCSYTDTKRWLERIQAGKQ